MSRYSIEGSTLTALGDAIREKTGKLTRPGYVDSDFFKVERLLAPGSISYQFPQGTRSAKVKKIEYLFHVVTELRDENRNTVYHDGFYTYYWDLYNKEEDIVENVIQDGYHFTVYNNGAWGDAFGDSFNGLFEITCYDENGEIIQVPGEVINTITPTQMAEEVQNILSPPPETAFTLTGDCSYRFVYSGWDWFIKNYGDKITTSNITNATRMFEGCQLEQIPITINLTTPASTSSMFYLATKLVQLPVVNNLLPNDKLCQSCSALKSINGNQFTHYALTTIPCESMFSGCFNLRSMDKLFDNLPDAYAGNSIYGMYSMFYNCYSLDELTNLPYIYSTYSSSSYAFGTFVNNCYRLKELTFRGPVVTSGPRAGANLKLENYTGWSNTDLTKYGIPQGKEVVDDASYQALKNDPDWWSKKVAYSRYNHDSAVNTINSLPDLSNLSYTNTISFKGAAGELTDGGAINTLTEEEIAVAAAKGWTVALT